MRVCAFDLDHTLVRTPLDLAAMALDMRAHLEREGACLPAREERYRVGELLRFCQREMPAHEAALWTLALDRETRAMEEATLESGALEALTGARRLGFVTALWTNNAGVVTRVALDRLGLAEHFDVVVTRDEMRELKPDPDGWRVIADFVKDADTEGTFMVGDSWVDGVAAMAAKVPFIAYRMPPADLARFQLAPVVTLTDLADLPGWLARR